MDKELRAILNNHAECINTLHEHIQELSARLVVLETERLGRQLDLCSEGKLLLTLDTRDR